MKGGPGRGVHLVKSPISQGEIIGGRYRVERIVAEGGMGIIVAAKHIELEENVAIKFLRDEFASKPEIVGRFAREAKAAAKIKSTYTATVHDVGISEERGPYIVMEFLEGEDLESMLQADGRINFTRATEWMMQAGEAICAAHAAGIIHRDIKPANLFLVKSDHGVPIIKVLDFGVSKTALTGNVFGGTISLVKTQSLVGSPIYMSPEQLRGTQDVTFVSDVWSIGAVLYELITGDTAFTGSSITELCAAVLEAQPAPISQRAPDCPPGLSDAIMRCLEKDPGDRFQTVAELVVALAPYAPKRARMSVDRVVAVSKSAGLLPESYEPPITLSPPLLGSLVPLPPGSLAQRPPPQGLLETMPEGESAPLSERDGAALSLRETTRPMLSNISLAGARAREPEEVARPRWPVFVAIGLVTTAALVSVVWLSRSSPPASAPATPPTTAAASRDRNPGVPPASPPASPPTLDVAPPAATAVITTAVPPVPSTRIVRMSAGKTAPALTKSSVPAAPASTPAAGKTDQVRSAIDDRK